MRRRQRHRCFVSCAPGHCFPAATTNEAPGAARSRNTRLAGALEPQHGFAEPHGWTVDLQCKNAYRLPYGADEFDIIYSVL